MDPTTPPVDLVTAARQTYAFSIMVDDGHEEALKAAISSVLEVHRAQVVSEIAETIDKYTDDLDSAEEFSYDTEVVISYLTYVSDLIRKMGHPEIEISTYVPQDGDMIQIIATGKVSMRHTRMTRWTLGLDRGDILDFDIRKAESGVRVRLLDRNEADSA
jgi:hypothetical protein